MSAPLSFAAEAAAIIDAAGDDGRAALATLTAAFEDRLAVERAARLRAEAALIHAAATRTAEDGYPCFPIGVIRSPFATKRGAPRQGALAPDTRAVLTFSHFISPDALDGLASFSHVYVMFLFSDDDGTPRVNAATLAAGAPPPTAPVRAVGGAVAPWVRAGRLQASKVAPPGLHGRRTGVFSTRSPHRPNSLGWSLCTLRAVDAGARTLALGGVDFVDGTPVVDVKPACAYDCGSCGAAMPIVSEAAAVGSAGLSPFSSAAAGAGIGGGDASEPLLPAAGGSEMRFPAWVRDPLHAPPPLRVAWEPAAEAAARAAVAAGRTRFYGARVEGAAGSVSGEADALVRAVTQCLGLDCRSVSHGRGTRATGHTTVVASARQEAAAAVLLGGGGSDSTASAEAAAMAAAMAAAIAPPPPAYELRFDGLLFRLRYRPVGDEAAAGGPGSAEDVPVRNSGQPAEQLTCVVESCEEDAVPAAPVLAEDAEDGCRQAEDSDAVAL